MHGYTERATNKKGLLSTVLTRRPAFAGTHCTLRYVSPAKSLASVSYESFRLSQLSQLIGATRTRS